MNIFHSIFLGVVQGLTEFLPVSSSGHLVIAQSFLSGFSQPGLLFDVTLHAGTLAAVIYYFRKRLVNLSKTELKVLVIGTLPAVFIGFLFNDWFETSFSDVRSVGIQLVITGVLCILVDFAKTKKSAISFLDALLIGIGQAIAIVPGISRSGATIFMATTRGIDRKTAAEFSFLLSIPTIAGAIILQVIKHGFSDQVDLLNYGLGFGVSFFVGFVSIGILLKLIASKQFKYFGVYSIIIGFIVFLMR